MATEATDVQTKPAPPVFPERIDDCIEQYVRLRDTLKTADEAHKTKTKAAREYLENLNGAILRKLEETGQESAKTKAGTAYRKTRKSATLADAALFRQFVIDTQQFDLADWRANPTAISDWIDTVGKGELPPGVNYSVFVDVGVRRPGEKE